MNLDGLLVRPYWIRGKYIGRYAKDSHPDTQILQVVTTGGSPVAMIPTENRTPDSILRRQLRDEFKPCKCGFRGLSHPIDDLW
jgi:hypothetical protein